MISITENIKQPKTLFVFTLLNKENKFDKTVVVHEISGFKTMKKYDVFLNNGKLIKFFA